MRVERTLENACGIPNMMLLNELWKGVFQITLVMCDRYFLLGALLWRLPLSIGLIEFCQRFRETHPCEKLTRFALYGRGNGCVLSNEQDRI